MEVVFEGIDDPPASRSAPSLTRDSSWSARASGEYPEWFESKGLTLLLGGALDEASRYYHKRVQRTPDRAEGWYGQGGVSLVRGEMAEAATSLARGWSIDDTLPLSRLLRDLCPDAPQTWYALAGALVALRRKSAYELAEIVLSAVANEPSAPQALRERATRVRLDVGAALETRAADDRDDASIRARASRWRAFLACAAIALVTALGAAVVLVAGGGGLQMAFTRTAPTVSVSGDAEAIAVPAPVLPSIAPPVASGTSRGAVSPRVVPTPAPVDATGAADAESLPADAVLHMSDDHGNGHLVKLNGEVAGTTPISLYVRPNRAYTVTVTPTSGKSPWKARVTPSPGQIQRLQAELPAR